MSDYFSAKPLPSSRPNSEGNTPGTTTPGSSLPLTPAYSAMSGTPAYSAASSSYYGAGAGGGGDSASIHSSGSQYLMDMIPDELTLKDNATYSHINTKDFILPKTDVRSPYYVAVPVPNPLATAALTGSSLPEEAAAGTQGADDEAFVREFPTDILIDRFYKWKKILKSLIVYLREVAYAQEQFARINHQIKGSIKFPFLTDIQEDTNKIVDPLLGNKLTKKQQPLTLAQQKEKRERELQTPALETPTSAMVPPAQGPMQQSGMPAASGFMQFGSGSIQDLQVILKKHHMALASQQFKVSKEITSTILPKLESLKKDLSLKIKEIKELHSDFKTNIGAHIKLTSHLLNKYIAAIKFVNKSNISPSSAKDSIHLHPKHDPFLLKLQLDLQLKRQLSEENYLQEAYINLQTTGLKLEKIIYSKIQHALQRYSSLIDAEARLMIKNLCQEMQQGMLSKPPAIEWDRFVTHHPLCLMDLKSNDPLPRPRKLSDIVYPNMKASMSKCIRAGYFQKKSNFIKEYKKGYFVLTPNYLHEFKSSNFFNPSAHSSAATTPSVSAGSSSVHLSQLPDSMAMTSLNGASSAVMASAGTNANPTSTNGKYQGSKKVNSLTPILSIPLNDCTLTDYTDNSFTLKGKATFIELEKRKASGNMAAGNPQSPGYAGSPFNSTHALHQSQSAMSLNPLENEQAKYITKKSASAFSKLFLKPVRSKQTKQNMALKKEAKRQQAEYNKVIEKESNSTVTWVFKPTKDLVTDEDKKHFKKWILDLKNLCSFNTVGERLKFIDDRIGKLQIHRLRAKHHHTASLNDASMANSAMPSEITSMYDSSVMLDPSLNATTNSLPAEAPADSSQLKPIKSEKPQYIPIQNTTAMDMNAGFRSRINTPMIDDNGNLITLDQRKPAFVRSGSATSVSPQQLPRAAQSPSLSNPANQYFMNTVTPNNSAMPHMAISSSGVKLPANAQVQNGTTNQHQRNISLPMTLGAMSPGQSPSDLSMGSGGSQGGYFAIPVHNNAQPDYQNTATNQAPVSLYSDDQVKQATSLSLSRTSSRGLRNSRHPSASSIPATTVVAVPKVHINNQEVKGPILPRQPPVLKKQLSTGSLPALGAQAAAEEAQSSGTTTPPVSTAFYQKGNGSATNLGAPTTPGGNRVHSYRKHKKNVSFGSLNSLMFSKKGGAYAYSSGNLMNGGILEDEDNEDAQSTHGSIKLNQSIYQ